MERGAGPGGDGLGWDLVRYRGNSTGFDVASADKRRSASCKRPGMQKEAGHSSAKVSTALEPAVPKQGRTWSSIRGTLQASCYRTTTVAALRALPGALPA